MPTIPPESPPTHLQRRAFVAALTTAAAIGIEPGEACAASTAAVGKPAPEFDLGGLDGQRIRLSALAGKIVYLDFWASWCGPCRQSFPWMNDMHDQLASSGLHVLAINLDAKRPDAMRFLAESRANFELAFDPAGDTPRLYGVRAMPTSFIINRKGLVTAAHAGFTPSRAVATRAEIESLLRNV